MIFSGIGALITAAVTFVGALGPIGTFAANDTFLEEMKR